MNAKYANKTISKLGFVFIRVGSRLRRFAA